MENNRLKIFITGASGLLGRMIVQQSMQRNYETTGIAFSRAREPLVKCDLTKPGEVEQLIHSIKPDFIVHAAAERSPEKAEKDYESAKLLNVETSQRLARVAKSVGSRIIYISTDYVFDGKHPPYKENDTPTPTNKYGETKFEGEKAMQEENADVCILRVPVLYGPVESLSESAVTCLLSCLLTNEKTTVSDYERRYPCHTRDIANIVLSLVQNLEKEPSLKGIFQWSGKEMFTKYGMVEVIARVFSLAYDHITPNPNPTLGAPRPYDARMETSRLDNLGICVQTKFEDGIKECLKPWTDAQKKGRVVE